MNNDTILDFMIGSRDMSKEELISSMDLLVRYVEKVANHDMACVSRGKWMDVVGEARDLMRVGS